MSNKFYLFYWMSLLVLFSLDLILSTSTLSAQFECCAVKSFASSRAFCSCHGWMGSALVQQSFVCVCVCVYTTHFSCHGWMGSALVQQSFVCVCVCIQLTLAVMAGWVQRLYNNPLSVCVCVYTTHFVWFFPYFLIKITAYLRGGNKKKKIIL